MFDRSNFTTECSCGFHWKLGNQLIKQIDTYKYLGIELDTKLLFHDFKTRIRDKARRNISKVWEWGMQGGCLSVAASINLYEISSRTDVRFGEMKSGRKESEYSEKWEEKY